MKRSEFKDCVRDWEDFIGFCNEEGLDLCEDIILAEHFDSEIDEECVDYLRNNYWYDLLAVLQEIPSGYPAYKREGDLEFTALNDYDLDEMMDHAAEIMDELDRWEAEDDEDEEDDYESENLISVDLLIATMKGEHND